MLTSKITTRIELPHEPGQWIEVKQPSVKAAVESANNPDAWLPLLIHCVVAWSYDDPVTPETVSDLDVDTALLLMRSIKVPEASEASKNASGRSTEA